MTRDKAKSLFKNDKNSEDCYRGVLSKVDEIYNAHYKEIKTILNTIENCTVMDLPDVVNAIKEDIEKKHNKP